MLSKLRTATVVGATLVSTAVLAAPTDLTQGVASAQPSGASSNLFGSTGIFTAVANTLVFIIGAVAVIMLIIGGLRYVLSGGESSAVKGAKDTILYAVIGIIVAALAFAAVSFVTSRV
jgi:hypothetical protein